jgi:hypothetical protein
MTSTISHIAFSRVLEPISTLVGVISISIAIPFLYLFNRAIYHFYFHPLHQIPGPKAWIVFPIPCYAATVRGDLDARLQKLHQEYGAIVRLGPNQLSFITAEAWKDIYAGHRQLPKAMGSGMDHVTNIIIANDADHSRFRKSLLLTAWQ